MRDLSLDPDDKATQPTRMEALAVFRSPEDGEVSIEAIDSVHKEQDFNLNW